MKVLKLVFFGVSLSAGLSLVAQPVYNGSNVTGQIVLTRTVNLTQLAQIQAFAAAESAPEEKPPIPIKLLPPLIPGAFSATVTAAQSNMKSLAIAPASSGSGFNALSHYDQRQANGGNQFSHEPPSPGIAVSDSYVLEGVNNAVMVYSTSGMPLLQKVLSTNEVFGLAPAIIRRVTGNVYGQDPTDIRVFYDQGIDRWFILQRTLDKDTFGNFLTTSHLYMAVSQTNDPTANYNIYVMDTTNATHPRCPCLADYPQVGADQYGFYISTDEYGSFSSNFVDASLLAISKASLASGARTPTAYQFLLPNASGFEFAIVPAVTPPKASYFVGNNGLEYFVSSVASFASGDRLAVWAMTNTASLATANPSPALTQIKVPTLTYATPDPAKQRPGFLTYGSTLKPPGQLALIDGGDTRVQSASYSGGRLYVTLNTQVTDEDQNTLVGGAYFILSPTFRAGVLSVFPLRQGYLMVRNNNLLRAAIGVNPQGKGAITFTLLGPDYYPSAAFIPIDLSTTGTTVQIAAPGTGPEDGFTGYPDTGFPGVGIARWGDTSQAVAAPDGSIWMATEYIPSGPRTDFANWGTFVYRYVP